MAKKKQLSKAEAFFVIEHREKMPPHEIAAALGVSTELVVAHLSSVPLKKKTLFAEHKGTVSMTEARSKADDEGKPEPGVTYNPQFYETVKNNIFIMDPDQPIR